VDLKSIADEVIRAKILGELLERPRPRSLARRMMSRALVGEAADRQKDTGTAAVDDAGVLRVCRSGLAVLEQKIETLSDGLETSAVNGIEENPTELHKPKVRVLARDVDGLLVLEDVGVGEH
jgi:hypothetical protein